MHFRYKPYLVIPNLIEQPTWGGSYIADLKKFADTGAEAGIRIGQSYELFGQSKLATDVESTSDRRFRPELTVNGDKPVRKADNLPVYESLSEMCSKYGPDILGKRVYDTYHAMPILIKLTQARGNSFQLHVKQDTPATNWKPKAESWYFLENSIITYGIRPDCDIDAYRKTCLEIDAFMQDLSGNVIAAKTPLDTAREKALHFIREANPWRYVNIHSMSKGMVADLASGAIHHSWEEHPGAESPGNIVYEIQQDVADPVSTIRSFDQGKFKDDGSIRAIQIEDYFTYIDTDPNRNNVRTVLMEKKGNTLIDTPFYSMDKRTIGNDTTVETGDCFHHIYTELGAVRIKTEDGTVSVGQGHSCLVPAACGRYSIEPIMPSEILISYIL